MTDSISTEALDTETLDIISNEVYRHGPPHELYTRLRREAPIIRHRGIEPGRCHRWRLRRAGQEYHTGNDGRQSARRCG